MNAPASRFDQSLQGRLVALLRTERIPLDLVAVIGELIAADARLNLWFSREAKANLNQDAILDRAERYEAIVLECAQACELLMKQAPSHSQHAAQVFKRACTELIAIAG